MASSTEADQIAAELKSRGIDPNNPPANLSSGVDSASADQIAAELKSRGIEVPKPSTLPSYASPAQQEQYPLASLAAKGLGVGLEALNAPLQAFGEPIRQAVTQAQGTNPGPYRVPTILQRLIPALQTKEQAPDMFSAVVNPAVAGYKGMGAIANSIARGQGVAPTAQAGAEAVAQKPGIPEAALSTAAALGSGEVGNLPYTLAAKPFVELGKMIETGELAGIPGSGMLAKAKAGLDFLPFGLENLTAKADPEVVALQKSTDPKIADAAKSLTPAGITGSPTQAAIEGFLRKLPFSSNIMQEKFAQGLDALKNVRQPIVEASKPATDLGLDVQQAISNSSNVAYENAQSLYKNASNAIPEGTKIPLNNLQETASNILKSQTKLPPGARASGASQILQDLAGSGFEGKDAGTILPGAAQNFSPSGVRGNAIPEYDYPTIQALRADLSNKIKSADAALQSATPGAKFQSSPEAGLFRTLRSSLDKDLTAFSDKTGGAFKSSLDQANATYSTYKQAYKNDKFVQSILNEQNPENVVNKVVKAAVDNPKALGTLKLNLPSQTLDDLQTYFIKDMTERNPDEFSPSHFVSQWNRIGEKRLTDILGPDKVTQLRPLYALSKASLNAERLGQMATGPSGAGVTAAGVGLTPALMMAIRMAAHGEPVKGAAMGMGVLGAEMEALPMLAKAYLSKPASKFLTRESNLVPSVPGGSEMVQTAGKISQPVQDLVKKLQEKYAQRNKF